MSLNCKNPDDVLKAIKDNDVRMVDVRFADLPGTWQHFSVPPQCIDADVFDEGIGFDGSSIRGFQQIQESDMMVVPDAETAFLDPFTAVPTLALICNVRDPVTGQPYSRDPRYIAQKAEAHLKSAGVADVAYFGPEAEFFVFNDVRYGQGTNYGFYTVDSTEGNWASGKEEDPNLGHKPRPKEGYFPCPPTKRIGIEAYPNPAARQTVPPTPVTKFVTRRVTSPFRRPTLCKTSAPRWCSQWRRSASSRNATTMRWPPAARPRSPCASWPLRKWPTT